MQDWLNLTLNKLAIVLLVLILSYSPLLAIQAFLAPLLATPPILLAILIAASPVISIAVLLITLIATYTAPITPPNP